MKVMRWFVLAFVVVAIGLTISQNRDKKAEEKAAREEAAAVKAKTKSSPSKSSSTTTTTLPLKPLATDVTVPGDAEGDASIMDPSVGQAMANDTKGLPISEANFMYGHARAVISAKETGDGRLKYPKIWSTTTTVDDRNWVQGAYLTSIEFITQTVSAVNDTKTEADIMVYYTGKSYGGFTDDYAKSVHFVKTGDKWEPTGVN